MGNKTLFIRLDTLLLALHGPALTLLTTRPFNGTWTSFYPTDEVVTHSSDGQPPITKSEDAFPVSGSLTGTLRWFT